MLTLKRNRTFISRAYNEYLNASSEKWRIAKTAINQGASAVPSILSERAREALTVDRGIRRTGSDD